MTGHKYKVDRLRDRDLACGIRSGWSCESETEKSRVLPCLISLGASAPHDHESVPVAKQDAERKAGRKRFLKQERNRECHRNTKTSPKKELRKGTSSRVSTSFHIRSVIESNTKSYLR